MKVVILLLALCFLSACSVSVAGKNLVDTTPSTTDLSYEYESNGCKTDKHNFSSHDDFCDGLKNDSLNHYCATDLRYDSFKRQCPEKSWQ